MLGKSLDPRVQPSDVFTSLLAVITLQRYDSISNEEDQLDYLFVLFFSRHQELLPGTISIPHDATPVVAALTSNDIAKLDIGG